MAVIQEKAQGGIILSASHNPRQWNALKLLNEHGEFLEVMEAEELLKLAQETETAYPELDELGVATKLDQALERHIEAILALKLVDRPAISKRNFKIVVDGINSVGVLAVPAVLRALGVTDFDVINSEITGEFAHNPEPLDIHLSGIRLI